MANILQDPRHFQTSAPQWGQEAMQAGQSIGNLGRSILQQSQLQDQKDAQQAQEQARQQLISDAYTAYEAGDRDSLVKIATQNPELSKILMEGMQFKSDQTKDNWVVGQRQIATGADPVEVLSNRVKFLVDQGADPKETLAELEEVELMTPEQREAYKGEAEMMLIAQDAESYTDWQKGKAGVGTGSGTSNMQDFAQYQKLLKTDPEQAALFANQVGITQKPKAEQNKTQQAQNFDKWSNMSDGQEKDAFAKLIGISDSDQPKVIPDALIEGVDPEVAEKGGAAYTAAGGGKDGLTAFQKVVDSSTELQKKTASPAMLKTTFPKASTAEMKQLQVAMDSAKTTELGLKAASTLRESQRKDKKGKAFQERAVELLTSIINSPDLGDVTGSIEGAYDIRPFSDDESALIADIEEAGNILTSDNLSLMSGVLSETDIKILKNLAGGALIRTRGEARFRADVAKMRDKLASQLIVTADEAEEKREASTKKGAPSGREGGVLNADANGNKAWVFPDGTYEEVQ